MEFRVPGQALAILSRLPVDRLVLLVLGDLSRWAILTLSLHWLDLGLFPCLLIALPLRATWPRPMVLNHLHWPDLHQAGWQSREWFAGSSSPGSRMQLEHLSVSSGVPSSSFPVSVGCRWNVFLKEYFQDKKQIWLFKGWHQKGI